MKFRLLDKDGKAKIHDGVMPSRTPVEVVTWGARCFVQAGRESDAGGTVHLYREVTPFKLGAMGR